MKRQNHPLHTAVATAVLATAGLSSFSTLAASPQRPDVTVRSQIQQTYRAERAACLDGSSTQERGACLAEASAVRREALTGVLGLLSVASNVGAAPTEPELQANALARCDAVPSDVRGDCQRRVHGGNDVIVIGSVAEGVIVRELIPDQVPTAVAQADTGQTSAQSQPLNSQPLAEGQPETAATQAAAESLPPLEPFAVGVEPAVAESLSAGEALVTSEPAQPAGMTAESEVQVATQPLGDAALESTPGQTETAIGMSATPATAESALLEEPAAADSSPAPAEPVAYPEWMIEQRYE